MPRNTPPNVWPPQGGPNDSVYTPQVAPPPSLRELREFQAWQHEEHRKNPTAPPPTWQEYQVMQQIMTGYTPVHVPPPALPLSTLQTAGTTTATDTGAAIDPTILAEERINALRRDVHDLRAEMDKMKAAARLEAEEADNEDTDDDVPRRQKTKRKRKVQYILCAKRARLSEEQVRIKEDLRVSRFIRIDSGPGMPIHQIRH